MIAPLAFVFLDEPLDDGAVKILRRERIDGEEVIVQHRPQLAAEPFADRHGEAHFFAPEDPRRQILRKCLAEHPFGTAFEQLLGAQAGREPDQLVVHKRAADFEAKLHRAAINLSQKIAGQIRQSIYQ